jgi:pyruvate, orthophosphate dikinase
MTAERAPTRRYIYAFDEPPALPADELTQLLGGKGASLVVMANDLRLPVPPGFVITSETCRGYLAGEWPSGLDEELRAHVARLGERVGRRFGEPADPLVVSVRSGAAVSMPGMMDTILNLGLNEATASGLAEATGDADFAADCLRRFRQGYRDVLGVDEVPDDPWLQLSAAIEAVFRSWDTDRARTYRSHEGIPDELGTAVTVQAMVFGNRGADSATGVLFTRNPATGEPALYGDVMFNAQGEDVVAGGHEPQPLSTLAERLPDVAAELGDYADLLERHYSDLCDIEFTIEQGRLWLLQARVGKRSPRAAVRMAIDMAEDPSFSLSREEAVRRVMRHLHDPPRAFVPEGHAPAPLTAGLPASPGVATGAIVTSSEQAEAAAADGRAVILVRTETSPEDVRGMASAAGVLTARGGLASHAAVVARGWGIPAVVGASGVTPGEHQLEIDGRVLPAGEVITIDGASGQVYAGELRGRREIVPEAATLLEWAAELGIELGAAEAERAGKVDRAGSQADVSVEGTPTTDDILRALLVKGQATEESLGEALVVQPADVRALVDELARARLAESVGGALRLTSEGRLKALSAFEADRLALTEGRCIAFLEAFPAYDGRMKQIVTAWQMREVGGEAVFNDHSDVQYDERLLRDLAELHGETIDWLAPLAAAMRRFAAYHSRLSRALDEARSGDQRFVASPRVDSYHGVWFELHEDLIRLAGRRRSEEAAAGRA